MTAGRYQMYNDNAFKIGLESNEDTRWIAVFLGPNAPAAITEENP